MFFWTAQFIARTFGLDISKVQRWLSFALIGLVGLIVLLVIVFGYRACKREPKLNQREIIDAQDAIETRNVEKQKEVLAESDVREQKAVDEINKGDAETKAAIEDAKKKYDDMTPDELAAELEKRR